MWYKIIKIRSANTNANKSPFCKGHKRLEEEWEKNKRKNKRRERYSLYSERERELSKSNEDKPKIFLASAIPGLFFVYAQLTGATAWHRDLNPWPFEHDSSPKTTRPGLPPYTLWVFQFTRTFDVSALQHWSHRGAAIAQWICLRLPSCRPRIDSQAHHLRLYHVWSYIRIVLYLSLYL